RRMGIRPGWGWLLLPACQALLVPREVSGREGETLSLRCWYARGYESYNKYWCRGAARGSCRKVVETAGTEVPRRHGRVSIADNRLFCVVLLTVEELSREDAGSYWCGVERVGADIMGPVTLTVRAASHGDVDGVGARAHPLPAEVWGLELPSGAQLPPGVSLTQPHPQLPAPGPGSPTPQRTFPTPLTLLALHRGPSHSAGLQNESLQDGQEPHSSPPSPSGPDLQVLLPTVVLLLLLAVVG
ncbi:CLM1 protein, partial [Odontophorus gujanensis]|nr:CLM1 protein [Odontophorus gujanensis]